jgi:hypothetical protein
MPKQKPLSSEKAEESEKPPKPPGFRKFEKLLKQVLSAPPRKGITNRSISTAP